MSAKTTPNRERARLNKFPCLSLSIFNLQFETIGVCVGRKPELDWLNAFLVLVETPMLFSNLQFETVGEKYVGRKLHLTEIVLD